MFSAYAGIADELSSALAKPIVCNPGTVEPWEMVDSKEMQHIEDYVGEIKPHSADGEQGDAQQGDGEIQTSVSSNLCSIGTENLINDVENQNTETDGAQEINVITHDPEVDGSICECTVKNGCEFKSKAQNDQICDDNGATFGHTNTLPKNKVDVETQSYNKDSSNKKIETKVCRADNEDDETGYTLGDIVFIESEMIPDVIENVDNHQHGLTSSRILSFVRKENPVKSIVSGVENPVKSLVSGVKSFMSRHKKAKLSTPEMDGVPKKKATEETSEKSLEKEQFESDVDDGSPSKFRNNGEEVNSDNHSKTSLNEEVGESILKHKIESETLLIEKSEDISEDLDGNVDYKEYHRVNHENITNPNCKSETEFIESDNNNLSHTENLLADLEYSNNDCSDHGKQTDTAKLVKPETEQTATIDCTNAHQVCESDMEVSDYSDKNENMIDTNEKVIETEACTVTDTGVNDTDMELASQYTEKSNVGVDESSSTKSLIIKIPQDDIVEDNKHNDRGDDDDDNDDDDDDDNDDPEDMETFLESISQHAEDTAMYSISSETGAQTQSKDEKQSKHIVDSVTTDLAAMNAENCDISEESNMCNSEIYENRNEITSDDTETFEGTNETKNTPTSELYAVCQELLDEATCHSQDIGASGYNDSIIASSSCHTIEDRSSYYFYGYDRRLSIHSEGSCDSIEDSHAWMTGQDIDIVEVDSNDIVTVINDCDQNTLRDDLFQNNPIEFDEAKFYIDTADQGIASLSENKAKTFSGTVSNDLQSKTCSAADNQSDLKYEKNTENMNSKAFVKDDKSAYEESVINEIKAVKSETVKDEHNPKTDTASVDENAGHVITNDLDSVCSDGASMSVVGGLTKKDNTEKCDKAKAKSAPTEHTTGIENNAGTDTTMKDVRIQNRRAMSLDLTNDLNSFANNSDFLSPMRSMTLPRSSTVPELLSGSVAPKLFSVQRNIAQSPIQLFRRLPIVKNPYMSPILAPDDMIQGLPMVYLIVSTS